MIIMEDVSAVPITASMLMGALHVLAQSVPRADAALRSQLVQIYAQTLSPALPTGALALAIGWRLDALAAFIVSPAGQTWSALRGSQPVLLDPALLDCAANESLITGKATAEFDNDHMLARLKNTISALNDNVSVYHQINFTN